MLYGFANEGMISRMSRLPIERVTFAVDKLEKKGLVMRQSGKYALTKEAAEALAMREYVKRDLIAALGAPIGKGKESDVYEALNEEGATFALKFFKLGRISFTKVRTKRTLDRTMIRSWMSANYEAAKREYHALKRLQGLSDSFPTPVAYNRSTVLFDQLSGVALSERPELDDPGAILRLVLDAARVAYVKAHLINGDLSEYNVLTDGARVWLIDWPQAVESTHPNEAELLKRDVFGVVRFFQRAYGVSVSPESALRYVRGESSRLE